MNGVKRKWSVDPVQYAWRELHGSELPKDIAPPQQPEGLKKGIKRSTWNISPDKLDAL